MPAIMQRRGLAAILFLFSSPRPSNASYSELMTPPSDHDDSAGDQVVKIKCWLRSPHERSRMVASTPDTAPLVRVMGASEMRRCCSGVFDVRYTLNSGANSNVAGYPSFV